MKNIILVLIAIQIISCGRKDPLPDMTSNPSDYSYANACCCNTVFDAGIGKVYVPSMFTPNNNGINDFFSLYSNNNVKYIVNVHLYNNSNTVNVNLDTVKGGLQNKHWEGDIANNAFYNGTFSCDFTVVDVNNTTINITANSAAYTLSDPASIYIPNYLNCKFSDQWNPFTLQPDFQTSESNFN